MLCARNKLSGEIPRRNSTKISYLREIRYQAKDKLSARNRLSVKVFTYVISRQYLKAPNLRDEKAKQANARVLPPTAILPCLAAADDDSNSQHSPPSSVPALLFSSAVRGPRNGRYPPSLVCCISRCRWHLSLVSPRLRRPLMMR